jgi:hypothetical protein
MSGMAATLLRVRGIRNLRALRLGAAGHHR